LQISLSFDKITLFHCNVYIYCDYKKNFKAINIYENFNYKRVEFKFTGIKKDFYSLILETGIIMPNKVII